MLCHRHTAQVMVGAWLLNQCISLHFHENTTVPGKRIAEQKHLLPLSVPVVRYLSLFLYTVGWQVWFQLNRPRVLQSKDWCEDESLFWFWCCPFHEVWAKWQHLSVCLRDQHSGGTTWFCAEKEPGQSGWTIAQSEREWWRGEDKGTGFVVVEGAPKGQYKSTRRGRSESGQTHNHTLHTHTHEPEKFFVLSL